MTNRHQPAKSFRSKAFRTTVGLGVAVALASISACNGSTSNSDGANGSGQSAAPKAGGSIIAYVNQQFLSFDPIATQINQFGAQGGFLQSIYDLLFSVNSTTSKVQPGLGESLIPSSDCKTWTMTLKPGITFSDGTPLNAAAVIATYTRILDPQSASPMIRNLRGATVAATGDLTLDIKLATANCLFDATVANNLSFIASPTAVAKYGKDYYANPVGAGPFMLKSWDRSAGKVVVVRNPKYYTPHEPLLDQITFTYATNGTTAVQSLIASQAQLSGPLTDPLAVDKAASAGLPELVIPMNGGTSLQYNLLRAPFNQLCARQAVAYGLNPVAMSATLNQTKHTSGATSTIFQASSPYYDASITFATNDAAKAQAAAATCASAGNPLTFVVTAYANFDQDTAEYIASRLNAIPGFKVTVKIISLAAAATTIFLNRDFQLTTYPGGMFFGTPAPALKNWLGTKAPTNLTGYSSPEMDAALQEAQSSTDPAVQKAAYSKVQTLWTKDLPFLLWGKSYYYFVYQKNLTGVVPVNPGNELLLLQKVAYTK